MNAAPKLGAYALGMLAAFGAAAGLGHAVGPIGAEEASHGAGAHQEAGPSAGPTPGPTIAATSGEILPGGLALARDGYALDLERSALPTGPATPVSFRILGPDGEPVTGYEESHDERMHLIAVRRDMTGFQHVHPELAADGTWSTPLELAPGSWRLFADFDPAGDDEALTLGADVAVAGAFAPEPLPEPSRTAEVDGYTVTLEGELVPGEESELTLGVSRAGRPVTDLQPHLAAYGHLVALRDGDLAYLHVHPVGGPGDGSTAPGPDITFAATAPSAGEYRLFLDFRHGDVVRTAEFTVRAGETPGTTRGAAPTPSDGAAHDDDHAHG